MTDDDPIPLREACALWPEAKLTLSTLRAEAARGRLDIFRMGKRDYTTPKSMREMVQRCREEDRRHGFTSTHNAINGSSETVRVTSAQAALNQTVTALKAGLPRISARSTRRNADQTHS
jgi:hypothetical protein